MRSPPPDRQHPDRRILLVGGAALIAGASMLSSRGQAADTASDTAAAQPVATLAATDAEPKHPTPQFDEAFAKIVGNGTPVEGRMTLELPEDAENGNIVPYRISVQSPMTADDHIARVHLLSTQNPQASVGTFHFTPLSGAATVSGRMRLAKTQDVVAIALTNTDTLLVARARVMVGIGGCGTE